MAESLIDRTREFPQRRPAYFILRYASIKVSRSPAARPILREFFIQAKIRLCAGNETYDVEQLGTLTPKPIVLKELEAGDVGFVIANIKQVADGFQAKKRRVLVTAEFSKMLSLYLEAKFR